MAQLSDIAILSTGFYRKPDPVGDTIYLQGKHFDDDGRFIEQSGMHPEILLDDSAEKHLLRDKDLLLVAKGEKNRTCLYKKEIGKAVASSLFIVIRLISEKVISEYVHWYMNSSCVRDHLEKLSRGSHIPSISKKALKTLEIPVPSLSVQRKVLDMNNVWMKERDIYNALIQEKENYYQNLLIHLTKEKSI